MNKKYIASLYILFFNVFFLFPSQKDIKVGADRLEMLLPLLENERVALVINHTSCLSDKKHTTLLDTLIAQKINVVKIFAPEHGFRGDIDAGKSIVNGKDQKTNLPVISLYGSIKKPTEQMLQGVDIVIFDIQDVGARFYTYISTMYYVMDACAEYEKKLVVLDRPNPHDFINGPVLQPRYKSFVGMYPIPILHGLTIGELALMTEGEKWLTSPKRLDLAVIPISKWKHGQPYSLPIKPSPNLPNDQAVKLYASLCLFEATNVSVGRGTTFPFQVIGYPDKSFGKFTFTPIPLQGFDLNPIYKNQICYGIDLRKAILKDGFTLEYFISSYLKIFPRNKFFKSVQFMNLLSGTNILYQQILAGENLTEIEKSWQVDLDNYKIIRKKYLLYPDK